MKSVLAAFTVIGILLGPSSAALAEMKPNVRYAQVDDVRLAYYTRGQGEPLLMINGFISTMSLWDPALLAELEKHHTLILFDNRGVGLSSDTPINRTTIEQMADDAAALVRQLGYQKVHILGWSMGARIAQQMMIRHPQLVKKGVLASANPGGRCQVEASRRVEQELNDPDVPLSAKIALTFPDDAAGKQAEQEVLARLEAAVKAGTIPDDFKVSKQTTQRQDRARTTLWNGSNANCEALSGIRIPVLLTDGRDDQIDNPRNSLIIANRIPFSWLAFFEGGHSFLFQSYQQFADTVNAFLSAKPSQN
jgi:pimeloyl-ACP methyl ester carboxylesterase